MIRKAFVMAVDPDRHAEYIARHHPIWPELESVLKSHGVHNYSIFLDADSHRLFGYVEIEDEERWNAIAATPECRAWWRYMSEIMPSNDNHSPVSRGLTEVFHLA